MIMAGENKSPRGGNDPAAVPLCSLPIPQEMAWDSTRASEVRERKRISQLGVTQCTLS